MPEPPPPAMNFDPSNLRPSQAAPRPEVQEFSAMRIQRFWRSRTNVRIYKYYRDLIYFRERGNPRQMLKSINPREASLLDAAAGVHVRFRLGGDAFPPKIYYKIYTHAALCDVGAFAPRDYTQYTNPRPADLFNKGRSLPPDGRANWYKRVENNGWRPVTETVMRGEDNVTQSTAAAARAFHYSRIKRREQVAKQKKSRKIEWMMKMYREGKQREEGDGGADGPRPGSGDADADGELDEFEMDREAEKLLQWTAGLDFEDYHSNWATLATTGRSDGMAHLLVPQFRFEDELDMDDAYPYGGLPAMPEMQPAPSPSPPPPAAAGHAGSNGSLQGSSKSGKKPGARGDTPPASAGAPIEPWDRSVPASPSVPLAVAPPAAAAGASGGSEKGSHRGPGSDKGGAGSEKGGTGGVPAASGSERSAGAPSGGAGPGGLGSRPASGSSVASSAVASEKLRPAPEPIGAGG
eukprot:tig00000737_g3783.t1